MIRSTWLLAALLIAAPVLAADDPDAHEQHPSPAAEDGAGHSEPGTGAGRLGSNLRAMRKLMAQIRETTDPVERRRLLAEHMLAMQEQIKVILATPARGGGHAHGEDAGNKGEDEKKAAKRGGMMGEGGTMGGGMMKMHQRMEQRVDALEQLLGQLIEHEAAEDDVPGD